MIPPQLHRNSLVADYKLAYFYLNEKNNLWNVIFKEGDTKNISEKNVLYLMANELLMLLLKILVWKYSVFKDLLKPVMKYTKIF